MKKINSTNLLRIIKNTKGIDKKKVKNLCLQKGSNPNNNKFKLKNFNLTLISKQVPVYYSFQLIKKKVKFFWQIKLYRGIKHMLKLPVHGQRTKTNSKTKRKFNFLK